MRFDTFAKRIAFGFSLLALIVIFSGTFAAWESRQLSEISHKIRDIRGPTVSDSLVVLNGLNESQSAIKSWLLIKDERFLDQQRQIWTEELNPAIEELTRLSPHWDFQEDIDMFQTVKSKLAEFRQLQDSLASQNPSLALDVLNRKLIPLADFVKSHLKKLVERKNQLMDADLAEQARLINRLNILQGLLVLLGLLASVVLSALLARSITSPIMKVIELANRIARGDYTQEVSISGTKEIGQLNEALESMRSTLEKKTWMAQAQLGLNESIRAIGNVRELADSAVGAIARHLQADLGALYSLDDGHLMALGGFAFPRGREPGTRLQVGQGLAGQAAVEKSMITAANFSNKEMILTTAAGDFRPAEAAAAPLMFQDRVIGVVELASSTGFEDHHREFLKIASDSVAIALNSTQRGEQVKNLLHETQAQAEELQSQQEELRSANEELQSRQEELESINVELEEQKRMLELQKEALNQKNSMLESTQSALESRARELDQVSKYKSEFLANMSHELRTPLNSQLILSQILEENREGNLNEKQREYARAIHSSGKELLQLINDILDLSKVEAGKLDLDIRDVELTEIVKACRAGIQQLLDSKGLSLEIEIDPTLPATIRTDSHRLEQVLRNFLSNGVKFTEKGAIRLKIDRPTELETARRGLPKAKSVAFRVIDPGIGIPKEKQELIFEAFQQVDSSVSRKYGGTGLGLAISKNLAALLGGEIHLLSQSGKGSTFTLVLPEEFEAKQPANATSAETAAPLTHAPVSLPLRLTNDKVILIIEDDPAFAGVLADLAKEKGFASLVAHDGARGLELAIAHKPSCILLDGRLPDVSGLSVLREIKANPSLAQIPVHMLSGDSSTEEAKKLGAIGYLVKPADPKQVSLAFERLEATIKKKIQRVLVIDDEQLQLDQIGRLIGGGATSVVGVTSAREALQRLRSGEVFDCLVLDLNMPEISGFTLLDELHKDAGFKMPPVIIHTARDLSRHEELRLRKFSESIIIKGTHSDARLLDEVSLFIHRAAAVSPRTAAKPDHDMEKVFHSRKVLVVDDDVRNIFALSEVLESKGIKISVAHNGQEVLDLMEKGETFDLILMDVMMPVMDGYEAMRRIRKSAKWFKTPMIALTAKAMKGDREACIEAGASDYLSKPIEVERLLTLMRVWLSK